MADVLVEYKGKQKRLSQEQADIVVRAGGRLVQEGDSPAETALKTAGKSVAMGKDDDLARLSADISGAVRRDLDAGNPLQALRRLAGAAAPFVAPGLGAYGLLAQAVEAESAVAGDPEASPEDRQVNPARMLGLDSASTGAGADASRERNADVRQSEAQNPKAGLIGTLAGTALTAGAATPGAKALPGFVSGAKAALPAGLVTGAESMDDQGVAGRIIGGAVGGTAGALLGGAGNVVLPKIAGALKGALTPAPAAVPAVADAAAPAAAQAAPQSAGPGAAQAFAETVRGLKTKVEGWNPVVQKLFKVVGGQRRLDDVLTKADDVVELVEAINAGKAPKSMPPKEAAAFEKALREAADANPSGVAPAPAAAADDAAAAAAKAAPDPSLPANPEAEAMSFDGGTRMQAEGVTPATPALEQTAAIRKTPAPPAPPKPIEEVVPVPKRRMGDDEAAALVRKMAIDFGTQDVATLSTRTGLPSGQVSRVLQKLVQRFEFRDAVAKGSVAREAEIASFEGGTQGIQTRAAPTPEAPPPAQTAVARKPQAPAAAPPPPTKPLPNPDLVEGVAAQNQGGKVTPRTLRQEAAIQRGSAQAVTLGDFADRLRALPAKDRNEFLRQVAAEKGVDFARKVAKMAGVSAKTAGLR